MSIYRRGKFYWFHFVWKNKHYQASTRCTNARAARSCEAAARTRLAQGQYGIRPPEKAPGFSDAVAQFLEYARAKHRDHPSTCARLATALGTLKKFFRDRSISDITVNDVARFLEKRANNPTRTQRVPRPATMNREISAGKILYAFHNHRRAQLGAPLIVDPFSDFHKVDEENEQTRVLSHIEARRYLDACPAPLKAIAALMLQVGLRPMEVLNLRREDVVLDGDSPMLHVRRSKTRHGIRSVPLSTAAVETLRRLVNDARGSCLFPGKSKDTPLRAIDHQQHRRAVKLSGVPHFTVYTLRHTFASRQAMAGTDPSTLSTLLGHRGIGTLNRYVHIAKAHQQQAVKRAEQWSAEQEILEHEEISRKNAESGRASLQKPLQ